MADTKISALTSGNPAQSGDEIPIARSGANYKITAGSIASLGGDVDGPASATDNQIALFDSTTGKLIKGATTTGLLKASSGVIAAATSGTDYAPATSGTNILKGSGSGGFSNASAGTDYQAPITLTTTGTSGAATFVGNTLNIPQYSSSGGTPGGSNTQIQFNNSGSFGGSANLIWDGTNVQIGATGALRLADTDSSNYVAFKSPGAVASNVTWTLPSADGTSNQVLTTNGSGTLSWSTPSGSGDVVGPASATDSQIALFNSTTGKLIKAATTTGLLKASSGVIAAAVSSTDYAPATTGTNAQLLANNGSGGFSNVTVGSNLTLSAGTLSATGGLAWQSVQTTGFTAVAGRAYPCNTTSAAFTVTLPASPSAGDQITLTDYAGTWGTNNLTVNPNGLKIQGDTANKIIATSNNSVNLVYIDSTRGWLVDGAVTSSPFIPPPSTVEYLVVAGGGGGGANAGGGGGGGGFRTNASFAVTSGASLTVTVGGGGNGSTTDGLGGSQGSNSVFSTITSAGGGAGSHVSTGGSGGSGGGAGYGTNSGGTGNTPSTTPSQGSNGGATSGTGASNYACAGGGGAGAVGGSASGSTAGAGGAGTASSITGTSETYAGGGGGSSEAGGGAGGAGGGGNGGKVFTAPSGRQGGGANTGGGAGGGRNDVTANGGSGIVVIAYPETFANLASVAAGLTCNGSAGNTTPDTSSRAGYKVYKFTAGTGTISW